jgi:lipopolysaccharide export system permease protein
MIPRIKRIDRYVIVSFAAALVSTTMLVAILFVALDAFPHLDDFVETIKRDGGWSGLFTIGAYYVSRFLMELGTFGEIVAIASAVVVVAGMAKANEFVALLAGGMSLRRMALPVLISCGLIGAGVFALRNVAGPDLTKRQRDDWRRIKGRGMALGESLSVQGRSGAAREAAVALSLEQYDSSSLNGRGFAAAVICPGQPFVDIRAEAAQWDEDAHTWRFPEGACKWSYRSGNSGSAAFERIDSFETALGPDLLEAEDLGAGVLGLGGLLRQNARPEFATAFHERLAQMFAPLALALVVLPFILVTDRTRVFQGTMLAIIAIVVYEVVARVMCGAAASGYIPAVIGGWTAPLLFCGLGAWRLSAIET